VATAGTGAATDDGVIKLAMPEGSAIDFSCFVPLPGLLTRVEIRRPPFRISFRCDCLLDGLLVFAMHCRRLLDGLVLSLLTNVCFFVLSWIWTLKTSELLDPSMPESYPCDDVTSCNESSCYF